MGKRTVGLDIGTSALRAVELVDNGGQLVLEAYGQVGLPPGAIVDGEVRDRAQVTGALRRLWREGGFKSTRVQLGVAGLRAITREMELPPLPPDELNDAVSLQAEDIVPFPIDRTALASTVISRSTDSEGLPLVRVLVAAAHRDLIDGVVSAVEDAGLEPVAIDLNTAALSRAFTLPGSAEDQEAVVSIGAGLTMVVVHQGGALQFVRTIDLGGDAITMAIASAIDRPFTDAEAIKRTLDGSGPHDQAALRAAEAVVDDLVAEIHSSIRYYASLPDRSSPQRILLTGGAARTVGLMAKMQRGSDIPVLEASPLSFVDISWLDLSPAQAASLNTTVAVPLGLALNGATRTRFDLMPEEVTVKRTERQAQRWLVILGVGLIVLLAALSGWRLLTVRSAQQQVSNLQATVHTITQVELPKYDKAVRLSNEVTSLQTRLRPLVEHEADWLVVLNQLGQYLPPTAVLKGADLASETPTGASNGSSPPPTSHSSTVIGYGTSTVITKNLTEVTQFGLAMAQSPGLSDVDVSGSVTSAATGIDFPVIFNITRLAHGQRTSLFEEPIP